MRYAAILLFTISLSGCQTGYYLHLAKGHGQLMSQRVPVNEALEHGELTPLQRQRLALTTDMLDFAEQSLALPVGRAYRRYVALERDWVVWNLVAAPEFSLKPHIWCFPIAGCNSYRGYFDPQRAERDAQRLREQGLEVYGGGAVAYSTLGWFTDPLTTPMLAGDETWIAELIFHELTHRRFWLKGDTTFNESLATAVGREGVRRWLAQRGDYGVDHAMADRARSRQQVLAMVAETRSALSALYDSGLPEQAMRERRAEIIEALRQRYAQARQQDSGLERYRRWFDGPLNNAQLNTINDYNRRVPAFDALLAQCTGEWACFWSEVERIAAKPAAQRERLLDALETQGSERSVQ